MRFRTILASLWIVFAATVSLGNMPGTFAPGGLAPFDADYFVVGGGGGGGSGIGGGGSGGRIASGTIALLPGITSLAVSIGPGGGSNTDGTQSSLGAITAAGGPKGQQLAGNNPAGGAGGSGAGAGGNGGTNAGSGLPGSAGTTSSITGSSQSYSDGGGGGAFNNGAGGTPGGAAGGTSAGAGGSSFNNNAGSGAANRGGGGGGGANPTSNSGGTAGSGRAVVRYPGTQRCTGGSVSFSGGFTIHDFTSNGTLAC